MEIRQVQPFLAGFKVYPYIIVFYLKLFGSYLFLLIVLYCSYSRDFGFRSVYFLDELGSQDQPKKLTAN